QAITLGWLVSYFEDKNAESWEGWVYALCVVVCTVTFNLLHHMYFFQGYTLGMEVRVMATMVIYDKILRLRLSSLGQMTTGHLVNLASSDVERFQLGATFFHFLWEAPLETLVVLYFGVSIVGVSFVAGYAALAFLVPMQAAFSRKFTSVRQRVTVLTDERVKLTNQAVTGARVMKMNAWEPALEREIRRQFRAEEIRVLLKAALLRAINEALFFVQPALLATIVFGTYNFLGNDLKPSEVFTTLGLLNITQFTMGKFFYMAIQNSSESWVSIKRLETLLLMKENEFLVGHLLEFDASVGASRAETSNPESRKKGVDDSATTVTAADDPVGSKMEAPAAAPSADCNDSSAIRRTASVDSAANGSGGSGRAGAISVQTSSFRWGDDGEDQVAESERVVKKLAVPERSIGTKATTYHGANTDGTHEQVDRNSDESATDFTLKSIDLTVEPGQLVGIVGPVGSAKSSLLMAVLREIVPVKDGGGKKVRMNHKDGTMDAGNIGVSVGGRVAYAPQEPWIQSGTVRDNILFGKPMDRRRYDAVVRDCSLEHDLSVLPAGDMTGIGDRGVNLSGGQKARLGLARMAYTRADVYIMDDPLSAVDPAVGRELFSRVVCGRLSGSTRLLVTHQVHYLRDAALDMMIVMQDGKIVAPGNRREISYTCRQAPDPQRTEMGPASDHTCSALDDVIWVMSVTSSVFSRSLRRRIASPIHRCVSIILATSCDALMLWRRSRHARVQPEPGRFALAGDGSLPEVSGCKYAFGFICLADRPQLEASDALSGLELGRGPLNSDFESDSKVSDDGEESDASALNDAIELGKAAEGTTIHGNVFHNTRVFFSFCLSSFCQYMHALCRGLVAVKIVFYRSGDTTGEGRSGNGARMPMEDDSKSRPLPAELVAEENKETGVLKRRTYVEFVKEMAGVWQIILILVAMALGQAMMMAVTVWIARWSQKSGEEQKRKVYVGTLIILTLGTVVVSVFRAALSFFALVRASHRTHDRMLARVVRSPILFFDSNPVGRILNRFTKDTHFMDDMLPMTLFDFLMSFFMVLGSVTLVLAVNPWMSPSLVPAAVYFMHLLNFYTKTSREVKRLEAVARSPVYSQLSETLDGLVTIRAFGVQKEFLTAFLRKVDDNTRAYFAYIFTSRWFGFRLETVALVVLTVCCFVAVAVSEYREAAGE
ncbi:unnamed protein product, partial [Sphacelaria rigidula]